MNNKDSYIFSFSLTRHHYEAIFSLLAFLSKELLQRNAHEQKGDIVVDIVLISSTETLDFTQGPWLTRN